MVRLISGKESEHVHTEFVRGLVRILQYVAKDGEGSGCCFDCRVEGSAAAAFLGQFVRDGIHAIDNKIVNQVGRGDYSGVWKIANLYLSAFGYAAVVPKEIGLERLKEVA